MCRVYVIERCLLVCIWYGRVLRMRYMGDRADQDFATSIHTHTLTCRFSSLSSPSVMSPAGWGYGVDGVCGVIVVWEGRVTGEYVRWGSLGERRESKVYIKVNKGCMYIKVRVFCRVHPPSPPPSPSMDLHSPKFMCSLLRVSMLFVSSDSSPLRPPLPANWDSVLLWASPLLATRS